jgi:hypothetical protein
MAFKELLQSALEFLEQLVKLVAAPIITFLVNEGAIPPRDQTVVLLLFLLDGFRAEFHFLGLAQNVDRRLVVSLAGGDRALNLEDRAAFVRRAVRAAKQIRRQPTADALPQHADDDVVRRHFPDGFLKPPDGLVIPLFPALHPQPRMRLPDAVETRDDPLGDLPFRADI